MDPVNYDEITEINTKTFVYVLNSQNDVVTWHGIDTPCGRRRSRARSEPKDTTQHTSNRRKRIDKRFIR